MKFLVTGEDGFIGRNLVAGLLGRGHCVIPFDGKRIASDIDGVFHAQTLHRGTDDEIMGVNIGCTKRLCEALSCSASIPNIVFFSTERAGDGSIYGSSKQLAESMLRDYAAAAGGRVKTLRLAGEFGKWAMPNYNSVTATFCYNIARNLPIVIDDPSAGLRLMYIDDIVDAAIDAVMGRAYVVEPVYRLTVGDLADRILKFKNERKTLDVSTAADEFTKKLYATYLSYLPESDFAYPVVTHSDNRGSFTELLRLGSAGQVSVNISHPHAVKGEHWHNTKTEKFIVVAGSGIIRFRRIDGDSVITYPVSGDNMRVIDIPPGYTHNIENTGETDMVTIMWANEVFDNNKPDTYYQKVEREQ